VMRVEIRRYLNGAKSSSRKKVTRQQEKKLHRLRSSIVTMKLSKLQKVGSTNLAKSIKLNSLRSKFSLQELRNSKKKAMSENLKKHLPVMELHQSIVILIEKTCQKTRDLLVK
jgi:hypothetical protein